MKNKIKKILFPFFKERHHFLLQKWWFRLLIVGYIATLTISLIIIPSDFFSSYVEPYLRCYDRVIETFDWGSELYNQEFSSCREGVMSSLLPATGFGVFGVIWTFLIHYFIQLFFFKVVVDFIVLGSRNGRGKGQ